MPANRTALALLVVGLVLLPGVGYTYVLDGTDHSEPYRMSAGYIATQVNISNATHIAPRYGHELSFESDRLQYRHLANDYRAPNQTRRVLETALANGTATTRSQTVQSDLRAIERNYSFLSRSGEEFYTYSLTTAERTMTVSTTLANDSQVAAAIRGELVANYSSLSATERKTFLKIRNATKAEDEYDYRPWSNESVPEAPIVAYNGSYYAVQDASHTDDFALPDGFLLGLLASGIGLVCIVAATGIWLSNYWRD